MAHSWAAYANLPSRPAGKKSCIEISRGLGASGGRLADCRSSAGPQDVANPNGSIDREAVENAEENTEETCSAAVTRHKQTQVPLAYRDCAADIRAPLRPASYSEHVNTGVPALMFEGRQNSLYPRLFFAPGDPKRTFSSLRIAPSTSQKPDIPIWRPA
ncbi:hypothetical protein M8818_006815 [Zalaria obscura]|uniref:Uncharacterized protein n=1 Tax=Zalaria obscura TaxID=2024903 RepID=A0ACC3S5M4_9PEZI